MIPRIELGSGFGARANAPVQPDGASSVMGYAAGTF